MKALTVRQPWASHIAEARKIYETRSFPTKHRGLLAIHAGKSTEIIGRANANHFPLGMVICAAQLVACHRVEDLEDITEEERNLGDFSPGRFAWELRDVVRFDPPIPARGNLGLWNWEPPSAGMKEMLC